MNLRVSPRLGRLLIVPGFTLLLCVLFIAPGGLGQAARPPEPAATQPDTIDCTNPIPGKWARLIGDDEILVTYRELNDPRFLQTATINEVNGSLQAPATHLRQDADSELFAPDWMSAESSDLDGNRKAELIVGFQNYGNEVAALADPFDGATYTDYPDWSDKDDRNNDDLMDVDVDAGNVITSDVADELLMVYRDDSDDIHVKVLDGKAGGYIANADDGEEADMYWDVGERGSVRHSAVVAADMNGDGGDEIAFAFKDNGQDLQVMVAEFKAGASVNPTPLYEYDSYTATPQYDTIAPACNDWGNKRPLDIAAGDLDRDGHDELVVAFRGGDCYVNGRIELMVFDYESEDSTPTSYALTRTNFLEIDPELSSYYKFNAATNISLAAGDVDGDGADEVALAYNVIAQPESGGFDFLHYVTTFEYYAVGTPAWTKSCAPGGPSCLKERSGRWHAPDVWHESSSNDEANHKAWAAVATGDLDQDGMEEVVLGSFYDGNGDITVYAFNAEAGISSPYSKQVVLGGNIWEMALAAGDVDGDSRWGQYTNNCKVKKNALVNGVVHAPPFWPEGRGIDGYNNAHETGAAYGMEFRGGEGTGKSATNSTGGSVEIEGEIKGIGGGFTKEWEQSIIHETSHLTSTVVGTGLETTPPVSTPDGEEPTFAGAMIFETTDYCYEYTEKSMGSMWVCTSQPGTTALPYTMEGWYELGPGAYPDSWVPLGMNLAQGRAVTQSSTYTNGTPTGDAWRAVDGNTTGDYYQGSVSATNAEVQPWWQVDLGGLQWIDAIEIWKRTDCSECDALLSDFYVFITETSTFPSNDPLVLANDKSIWHEEHSGVAAEPTIIPVGEYGRIVRIQLGDAVAKNYLELAEVKIYGMPGLPFQWPSAPPQGALGSGSSFNLTWPSGKQQTVAGTLYGRWPENAALGVQCGVGNIPFTFGKGVEGEDVMASGTDQKYGLGLQIKMRKGERWQTYGTETSNIATWGREVTFDGKATGTKELATPPEMAYHFFPYVWLQSVMSYGGVSQKFLVLDYWVQEPDSPPECKEETPVNGPLLVPQPPVVSSPAHPDPAVWSTVRPVTFEWQQPAGDAAAIASYDWVIDHDAGTVPPGTPRGSDTHKTFYQLADGIWTMHVRAMNDAHEWGDAGHRTIRIDANAPKVALAVTPKRPTGRGGWYVTPLTVAVSADDGTGSGVTAVEVSLDGVNWQPYVAALPFSANTPGTTLYARARDAAGHVSEPVSTTFKIDSTAPDSHVAGGAGPGAWVAEVVTNAAGNEELVLAGSIADGLSGRHGIDINVDGLDWTGPTASGSWHPFADRPQIEVNWYYTATDQLGAGYHIFTGRAFDVAGNQEPEYEIARVLWLPKATPDVGGSSVSAAPSTVRPGQEVLFTLVARNAGFQEAHVTASDTLPAGLEPALDRLPSGVVWDAAARTLTWPARLLWPGQSFRRSFVARVDAGLAATRLENRATFHAFWPNTDLLPAADRQKFLDKEQTVVATATVTVDPSLPADADTLAPWAILGQPAYAQVHGPQVALRIVGPGEAQRMYVREWTPDPVTGDWIVRRDSGWIDYRSPYTWTLSAGQGVKYLGAWLRDAAGNVSTLSEHSLMFVNRMDGSQGLAAGQRVQYRGLLTGHEWIRGYLKTLAGDPDLYVWHPRNAHLPDYRVVETMTPGRGEMFSRQFNEESGSFLMEVQGVGASEYEVRVSSEYEALVRGAGAAALKPLPEHPLTVSDPLSAGQVGPDVILGNKRYLPVIFRSN